MRIRGRNGTTCISLNWIIFESMQDKFKYGSTKDFFAKNIIQFVQDFFFQKRGNLKSWIIWHVTSINEKTSS